MKKKRGTYVLELHNTVSVSRLSAAGTLNEGEVIRMQSDLGSGTLVRASSQLVELLAALIANPVGHRVIVQDERGGGGLDGLNDVRQRRLRVAVSTVGNETTMVHHSHGAR